MGEIQNDRHDHRETGGDADETVFLRRTGRGFNRKAVLVGLLLFLKFAHSRRQIVIGLLVVAGRELNGLLEAGSRLSRFTVAQVEDSKIVIRFHVAARTSERFQCLMEPSHFSQRQPKIIMDFPLAGPGAQSLLKGLSGLLIASKEIVGQASVVEERGFIGPNPQARLVFGKSTMMPFLPV